MGGWAAIGPEMLPHTCTDSPRFPPGFPRRFSRVPTLAGLTRLIRVQLMHIAPNAERATDEVGGTPILRIFHAYSTGDPERRHRYSTYSAGVRPAEHESRIFRRFGFPAERRSIWSLIFRSYSTHPLVFHAYPLVFHTYPPLPPNHAPGRTQPHRPDLP